MPVEIRVPPLGESVVEATVGRWLKQEGEPVAAGETLVELETDKVNLEVAAPSEAGVLAQIVQRERARPSQSATCSALIADGAGAAARRDDRGRSRNRAPTAPGARASSSGARQHPASRPRRPSRRARADRPSPVAAADAPPSTASTWHGSPAPAPAAGSPGRTSMRHARDGGPTPASRPERSRQRRLAPQRRRRTPAAEPAASARSAPAPAMRREERSAHVAPPPDHRRSGWSRRSSTAAMLTTFNEIDMTAVMDLRAAPQGGVQEAPRRRPRLHVVLHQGRRSARSRPSRSLNAEIQGDEIVLKHYYDIGIAVGAEDGLVVPVVRDADRKSFAEIEREIADAGRARRATNTLTLDDLRGGTFTITNGGVFGSLLSTPILNPPQVGILGMHKIQQRPVAVERRGRHPPDDVPGALLRPPRSSTAARRSSSWSAIKELIEDPERCCSEGMSGAV